MKTNRPFKRKLITIISIAILIAATMLPATGYAKSDKTDSDRQETIKVGYFNLEDYMLGAEEGAAKSGFAYDLLCEIATINGWNYEFVYGDFSELFNMLKDGEIDILPCTVYTEERTENMLFSEEQVSEECYFISARNEDLDGDPEVSDLNGKRLSTVKDANQNKIFEAWAKEQGISMKMVYADQFDESWDNLKEGKADYILNIDNSSPDSGYTTLYEIGASHSHFAVAKGKEKILNQVNSAIDTIYEINPFAISHLQEKYLSSTLSSYKLSSEEQKWLNDKDIIRVAGFKNDAPYTYANKSGKVVGVYPDMFESLLKKLHVDIDVEWTLYNNLDDMHAALKDGTVDLVCPDYHGQYYAQSENIIISESIQNVIMGILYGSQDGNESVKTIATPSSKLGFYYVSENYPDAKIIERSSVDECIAVVANGTADAAVAHVNALEADAVKYFRKFDTKNLITGCPVCFSANPEDRMLISIVNRGLHLISDGELQTLEGKYTKNDYSVWEFVRNNALLVFLMALAALLMVILFIGRTRQSRKFKKSAEQLSSYKKALLAGALISLEVNVSRDILYYGVWVDDEGNEVPLKDILGIEVPCSYNEYIKRWNDKFVYEKSEGSFSVSTNRQTLLDSFNSGNTEVTFDYEADTISGHHAYLRRDIFMHRNIDGDVIAYTTVKDISDIGKARATEESYISALATEYDCVNVVDFNKDKHADGISIHHRIVPRFEELMPEEWAHEDNISKRLDYMCECVVPEDRELFYRKTRREAIIESFENGEPVHIVDFRLPIDDDIVYYQERFIPIRNHENELTGMVACIRCTDEEIKRELGYRFDIEQARVLAESASQAKTAFLFNMSHDIRTPMNAILGFTRMAKKHLDEKERVIECLSKLEVSADQLLNIINDVLEMSRIEAGKLDILEQPGDIFTTLEDINPMLESLAISKSVEYTTEIENIKNRYVMLDKVHCDRVLVNIITNAIKYTPEGGKVHVSLQQISEPENGRAEFRYIVSDTGIGMSEEFTAHMFEQFSRERTSTASNIQGTGLGLAIVKRITDAMGGTIEVDSKLGEGSTFIFTVPLRVQTVEEISKNHKNTSTAAREASLANFMLKGKKILLVEDNELNREIAEEMLIDEGFIVDSAEDGKIAVDMVKAKGADYYDFILMDIQMPIMNGYEATRAIREFEQGHEHIPIIAASANAFDEDVKRSLEAGMDAHIAKPVNVEKMKEIMTDLNKEERCSDNHVN